MLCELGLSVYIRQHRRAKVPAKVQDSKSTIDGERKILDAIIRLRIQPRAQVPSKMAVDLISQFPIAHHRSGQLTA